MTTLTIQELSRSVRADFEQQTRFEQKLDRMEKTHQLDPEPSQVIAPLVIEQKQVQD